MKKPLLAVAGLVLTGGVIGMSYLNTDEEPKTTGAEITQVASRTTETQEAAVTLPAPTERTVSISGYPWEELSTDIIITKQNNGETVFLFNDAEPLENIISDFAVSEEIEGAPITKQGSAETFANYLKGFIQGTQEYFPDKKDYFLKLSEVENALNTGNFEAIPAKIEEAKVLRMN